MTPCVHRGETTVHVRAGGGGVAPRRMIRCALVAAQGITAAVPPEHCERCLADAVAPGTAASEVNRQLVRHLLMRRIQAGDAARHPKTLDLGEAVRRAVAAYGAEFVQDALVEAVRRGRLTPERALALAGEEAES